MSPLTRRAFAVFSLLGASRLASAQTSAIPDGIYLVSDSEQDESIWVARQNSDQDELLQPERLMPLAVASAEAEYDENWRAPLLYVTLDDSLREQFGRLT